MENTKTTKTITLTDYQWVSCTTYSAIDSMENVVEISMKRY